MGLGFCYIGEWRVVQLYIHFNNIENISSKLRPLNFIMLVKVGEICMVVGNDRVYMGSLVMGIDTVTQQALKYDS